MERVLVGGPEDGRRIDVNSDVSVIKVPVKRPVNVESFTRGQRLSWDTVEYRRSGDVYRWEGLIEDAYAVSRVSAEVMADPMGRRYVREALLRHFGELAPGKVVDGVIWRLEYNARTFLWTVTAIAGGKRVKLGLYKRAERRGDGLLPYPQP